MFLFNWFRTTKVDTAPKSAEATKELPKEVTKVIACKTENETYTIKKDEFESLMGRLKMLEEMVNALPNRPLMSPRREIEIEQQKKEKPRLTPFQAELEERLERLRKGMGESHGYDGKLENLHDLDKFEQSVFEQSMIYTTKKNKSEPATPIVPKLRLEQCAFGNSGEY